MPTEGVPAGLDRSTSLIRLRNPTKVVNLRCGKVRSGFWDFSTVSTARHFHSALQAAAKRVQGSRIKQVTP